MSSENTFIIAELSANHNNNFDYAVKTIESIAECGADAVKVQTYTAESLTLDVDNEYFGPRKDGPWKGKRPFELFKEASMPYEWQPKLKSISMELGLQFFSSPFDKNAVDFLEKIDVPKYKIASLEITDIPLIQYTASKMKPMIISTGVASLKDIEMAVDTCNKVGNHDITLLKCTSEYPAPITAANLKTIPNLRETFGVKVGVSDHSMGSTIPIVAVALGATVVEKHFILDRSNGGPDSAFSMEPSEFKAMVKGVREAEVSLGSIDYSLPKNAQLRRRSLFIAMDIGVGEFFTEHNIKAVRPGHGLHPSLIDYVLGKKAKYKLLKGTPLQWDCID